MSPIVSGGGGGGSQPVTVSHTYTLNRAGGFVSAHTFDLGQDAAIPVLVRLTLLSFTGDGETLGNDPGTIYVGAGSDPLLAANSDNAADFRSISPLGVNHYVPAATSFVFELQGDGATPEAIALSARYLKVEPQLVSNDTGATYAGANNPAASVQVDVTKLT